MAAHREGRALSEHHDGDSRQLLEYLIASPPDRPGMLTSALALLRTEERVPVGEIRGYLDESASRLGTWIEALEGYRGVSAADEKWRDRLLGDWCRLYAKIEAALAVFDADMPPSFPA